MSNNPGPQSSFAEIEAVIADAENLHAWLASDQFGLVQTFQRLLKDGPEGHALIAKALTTAIEFPAYDKSPTVLAHYMLSDNAEYDKEMTQIVLQLSDELKAEILSMDCMLAWNKWNCPFVKSFKPEDQLRVLSAGNAGSAMLSHDAKWFWDFLQTQTPEGKKSLLKAYGTFGDLAQHDYGLEALEMITDDYTPDDIAHCLAGSMDALIDNGLGPDAIQLLKRASVDKVAFIILCMGAPLEAAHHGCLDELESALIEIFPDSTARPVEVQKVLQQIQTFKNRPSSNDLTKG